MAARQEKANPAAYGCDMSKVKPSFDVSVSLRTNQLKAFVPRAKREPMPSSHNDELVIPLERIEGIEIIADGEAIGAYPEYRDINPQTDLWIDRNYQRLLKSSDLLQIERIGKAFNYEKVKALTCFKAAGDRLLVTDGQKTALAAIHKGLKRLPALIYDVPLGEGIERQATSFVGINTDRRAILASELLTAMVVAGAPEAKEFSSIMLRYGISPRDSSSLSYQNMAPGETTCIALMQASFRQTGRDEFEALCRVLIEAQFRPIRREHIGAVRVAISKIGMEYLDHDRLSNAIRSIVDKHARLEALDAAKKSYTRTTVAQALAAIYLIRYKRNAKALNASE